MLVVLHMLCSEYITCVVGGHTTYNVLMCEVDVGNKLPSTIVCRQGSVALARVCMIMLWRDSRGFGGRRRKVVSLIQGVTPELRSNPHNSLER